MGIRNVPTTVKDTNLAAFLRELRAAIGNTSDQITKLTQISSSGGDSGGGGSPGPGGTGPDPNGPGGPPVGDGQPPPAPTSLQAIPGSFNVTLVWTNPIIPDLAATEVWARRSFADWNATYDYLQNAKVLVGGKVYRSKRAQVVDPDTNLVTTNKGFSPPTNPDWWEETALSTTEKSKVGESAGLSWIHDGLTPGETWAYWVRNRDIENLFSAFFPDDDIGIVTTTVLDPRAYLELLTNSITATQLYSDLGRGINLIDGPIGLPGSVATRVYTEETSRKTADEALSSRITEVSAGLDDAAAMIRDETTARVNADGVLAQNINQVQAKANENSALITDINQAKIGYCTISGRTSEHKDKPSCVAAGGTWNVGLPWATAVKQVSVSTPGVCYKNGAVTGHTSQSTCEANGGAWTPGSTTALEQQFIAQQQTNGQLYSQYTIKIDTNGWVSGFGLANTQQTDGTVVSDFGVRADRFWIAPPNYATNVNGTSLIQISQVGGGVVVWVLSGPTRALVRVSNPSVLYSLNVGDWITLKDVRTSDRVTQFTFYNGSWQIYAKNSNTIEFLIPSNPGNGYSTTSTTPPNNDPPRLVAGNLLPFIVATTPRTYNGITIPAGVFMNTAFIVDASITNAKIYGDIRSIDYNGYEAGGSGYGTAGWCINKLGLAVFNQVIVRSGINIGNNSQVKVATLSNGYVYTSLNGGQSGSWNVGSFTFIGRPGQTRSLTLVLDMETALPTNSITAVGTMSNGTTFPVTFFYKSGSPLDARAYSGTLSFPSNPTGTSISFVITARIESGYSSGNARMGDVRLTVIEALG